MNIKYYPNEAEVMEAVNADEPLLAAISFDGKETVIAPAIESGEHHIMLMQTGHNGADIDKFFRIAFDKSGADWTFVCPLDYKRITLENRRVAAFYKDGIDAVSNLLRYLKYPVNIGIPRRYRGQLDVMGKTQLDDNDLIIL
ncbi:MAG: hypothetical protein NC548_53435 [Lachnospiraceae bacterium]|nr:hypothetical protein [Lachnospiraceae bacterium]MCM1232847.1 hypothetical protein [Ruminococcus flavefaciens]